MPYDSSVIDSEPAVIYRLFPYSDNSAIAAAVTPNHGKIRLFMKNVYGKKSAPICLIPGSLSFALKSETSDLHHESPLHRFRAFSHSPDYYLYIKNADISIRLALCFDFFDKLFHPGESSDSFWQLILKFSAENFREISLYTIYRLLKDAGFWFYHPCACGKMEGSLALRKGEIICQSCPALPHTGDIIIDPELLPRLPLFGNSAAYRSAKFSPSEETAFLKLFGAYIDSVLEKKDAVKSIKVFSEMALLI
jgi:recombinational DNA repair protein (RecF pathway)